MRKKKSFKPFFLVLLLIWIVYVPVASYLDVQVFLNPQTNVIVEPQRAIVQNPQNPTWNDIFNVFLYQNAWELLLVTAGCLTLWIYGKRRHYF